jgi:polypeptide N-acetylgalactosaminyltransferase
LQNYIVPRVTLEDWPANFYIAELLNANMFDPRPNEGKNGQPVVIPSHKVLRMQQLFQVNRFNLMASDRIPLDRSLPDVRKKR